MLGRKELQHFQPQLVSGVIIGRGRAAGETDNALLLAVLHKLHVKSGSHHKHTAGGNGSVHLLSGQHGTGTNQHLRVARTHDPDGFIRTRGTERNLRNGNTAGTQGIRKGCRITLGIGQLNDRHHADFADLFLHIIHKTYPPSYSGYLK